MPGLDSSRHWDPATSSIKPKSASPHFGPLVRAQSHSRSSTAHNGHYVNDYATEIVARSTACAVGWVTHRLHPQFQCVSAALSSHFGHLTPWAFRALSGRWSAACHGLLGINPTSRIHSGVNIPGISSSVS